MPQNHRPFLCQFIPRLTFPISICCLPTLDFSFPCPHPLSAQSPSIPSFWRLCKTSSWPIHHHRSHPDRVLFLLLLTCFHSPNRSRSIIRAPSSVVICQQFSFTHSCITPSGVHLSSVLSDIPGGLYFIQPTRPQVGIAVLVRAGVWVKAVWDSLLQGATEWDRRGRQSG